MRRRNDASQPYRLGSRSVPRRPSFNFAELVSPHRHPRKGNPAHPYTESGNAFLVLLYNSAPLPSLRKRRFGVAFCDGAPKGTILELFWGSFVKFATVWLSSGIETLEVASPSTALFR
jgi:hypothetical protein